MNAAITYIPTSFVTARREVMGRYSATEGFLKAFVRHANVDHYYCYCDTSEAFRGFAKRVAEFGGTKPAQWIRPPDLGALSKTGCLFRIDPQIGRLAWQRRHFDQRAYSLCGITHSITHDRIMDTLGAYLLAPVQTWDALICTSRAAKDAATRLIDDWGEYLGRRFGRRVQPLLKLPVIPLGVDSPAFRPTPESEQARAEFRRKHDIREEDVAVLFLGRLSFRSKANPLPMYLGLERAARRTGKRIHLILAGRFFDQSTTNAFRDAATRLCPSVPVVHVDAREPVPPRLVWHMADIFTSLSDNIQETFGLTPVEAMAAGLPVVASDWNGYRGTVRDGVDGILVPTLMPQEGAGEKLMLRNDLGLDSYSRFVGQVSQCVVVDVEAASVAYARLAVDPDLRRRMGEAGRQRAREEFDWSVVIGRYQDLWAELAERRRSDQEAMPRVQGAPAHPLRPDPFRMFAGYPTMRFGRDHVVVPAPELAIERFRAMKDLAVVSFADDTMAAKEDCERVLRHLIGDGATTLGTLLDLFPREKEHALWRAVARFAKMGLVRIEPPR